MYGVIKPQVGDAARWLMGGGSAAEAADGNRGELRLLGDDCAEESRQIVYAIDARTLKENSVSISR